MFSDIKTLEEKCRPTVNSCMRRPISVRRVHLNVGRNMIILAEKSYVLAQ